MATMDFAEVHIDPRYHRHIIGKNGANGEYIWFIRLMHLHIIYSSVGKTLPYAVLFKFCTCYMYFGTLACDMKVSMFAKLRHYATY